MISVLNPMAERNRFKVLIVEDNRVEGDLIEELLLETNAARRSDRRLSVGRASRLGEARDLLIAEKFDVILLDLSLPDSQGLSTIVKIQEYTVDTPIVVLAARNDEELAIQSIQAGAQDYLVKRKIDSEVLGRSLRYAVERHHNQEALRKSEEKYRSVVENSLVGIAIISPPIWQSQIQNWEFLEVNDALCNLLGYQREELLQENWKNLSFAQDWKTSCEQLKRIIAGEIEGYILDKRWRKKDGKIVYTRVSLRCIRRPDGSIDRMIKVVLDVSDRHRYEIQLKASKQFLRHAINATPDPIFVKDEQHRWIVLNDAFCELMGKPRQELIGKSGYDFLPPEKAEIFWQKDEEVLRTGIPDETEEQFIGRDGKERIISIKKTVFEKADGKKMLVGTIRDVTEYKHKQIALEKSESQLEKMSTNLPGMIYQFVLGTNGKKNFNCVSAGSKTLYKLEPEEIEKNPDLIFGSIHPDDVSSLHQSIEISAAALQPWYHQWRHIVSDEVKWMQSASRPEKQANGDIIWDGVVMDVTELKQTQQERDRLFSISLDLLSISGFDGYFKRLNPAWENALGYSRAELLAQPSIEFVHPEDRQATLATLETLKLGNPIINFENRYLCKDGSYKWLSWTASPFAEEGLIYAVARDVTASKQAEAELRKSEATNRALLDAIPDMMFRCRADGTFIDFKPAKDFLGTLPENIFIGKKAQDVLPPALAEKIVSGNKSTVKIGEIQIVEYQQQVKGKLCECEARIVFCTEDEIIAIVRDITERKRAESALGRQAVAMEKASDGIAMIDAGGEVIYCNAARLKIYGYDSLEELLGKSWKVFYEGLELQRFEQEVVPALVQNGYYITEAVGCRRDGSKVPIDVSLTLLAGGEIICIVRDISTRKKVEKQLQSSQRFAQQIAEASPNILYVYDIIEHKNIYVNASIEQILGYTVEEIQSMRGGMMASLIHPEDLKKMPDYLQQVETGSEGDIFEIEYRMRHKDGSWRWIVSRDTVFEKTASGQLKQILGTGTDFTESKQAEDEIKLLLAATQAISESVDFESAIADILRLLCKAIGWNFAEAWMPTSDGTVLELSQSWYTGEPDLEKFGRESKQFAFAPGVGMPGRIWLTKKVEWNADVSYLEKSVFSRAQIAGAVGLKAAFGVPILADAEVMAVLVFYKDETSTLEPRLLELVKAVATQLGSHIQRKQAEEELRKSEERWQLVLKGNQDGIWDLNLQTNEVFRSARWQEIIGYSEGEINSDNTEWTECIHPDDAEGVQTAIQNYLNRQTPNYAAEYRLLCKDGSYKWVLARAQAVWDEAGNPLRMVGSMTDISDRKQAELDLLQITQAVESTSDAIGIADVKGRSIYHNQAFIQRYGYTVQELNAAGGSAVLHGGNKLWKQVFKTIRTGQSWCGEIELKTKEGEAVITLVRADSIKDKNNNLIGLIGVITDITKRKEAEAALHQQLKRERLAVAMLERIRSSLNLEEILTKAVEEVRHFLQVDRTVIYRFNPDWSGSIAVESVGENCTAIVGMEIYDPCFGEAYVPLYKDGRIRATDDVRNAGIAECYLNLLIELEVRANLVVPILQGENLWGLLIAHHCTPRPWQQFEAECLKQLGVQLAIAIQQSTLFEQAQIEIADRKQAEAALQLAALAAEAANKAKSEFLANMSHELRTPLNGILGYIQLLKSDKNLTAEQQESLNSVQQCGEHLLTLINDVLDLAKIEASKMELSPAEVSFPSFIKSIVDLFQMRASQKGIEFTWVQGSALPDCVLADEKRLRQVLINLLSNAVKFTKNGGVTFTVGYVENAKNFTGLSPQTANCGESSPGQLRFEIEDTGIGIEQNKLQEIFLPFHQVGDRSNFVEGTGLGLSISQKLVKLMGSEIRVRSTPGRGSIFWLDIDLPPIAQCSQLPAAQEQRRIIGFLGLKRKVLIVDDHEVNRAMLHRLLSRLGFEIALARDGEECLHKALEFRPDVILMDLLMPVMDGWEATRRLRQLPEFQDAAILALSASVYEATKQESILAGCDDFLTKPIQANQLLELLRVHLALEWIYEDGPGGKKRKATNLKPPSDPAAAVPAIVSPPTESVLALLRLAAMGDIEAILEESAKLENCDPQLVPFVNHLRQLVKAFQLKQIRDFLKQHLS